MVQKINTLPTSYQYQNLLVVGKVFIFSTTKTTRKEKETIKVQKQTNNSGYRKAAKRSKFLRQADMNGSTANGIIIIIIIITSVLV